MIIGWLSSDVAALRGQSYLSTVPPTVKAEAKGQQGQHELTVFLTKLLLQLVKPLGTDTGFPWHIIAVFLGTTCFLLLLAIAGLGYMYFQSTSECKIQDMEDTKEQNTSCAQEVGDHSILPPSTACATYQGKWICDGENCYYFSKEEKTWNNSKDSCEDLNSSLVKIDDKDEQVCCLYLTSSECFMA
ncbi:killer cell lectin-like receptor 2 [Trichechus inunguis]